MRKITDENFLTSALQFGDRQAGVAPVYDPETELFSYNTYCVERTLLKEIFTCEYASLDEALACVDAEFGTWELFSLTVAKTSGCGTCAAKKSG